MKRILRLLSFLTPFLLIAALLLVVDFSEMATALKNVNILFYMAAFVLYAASYLFRALRLSIIFKEEKIRIFFLIICSHMLLNHMLPFRTGEFSLPFFMKRVSNISYSNSIPFFILLRLFDIISIFISFLFVFFLLGYNIGIVNIFLIGVLLLTCIFFIFRFKIWLPAVVNIVSKLLPRKISCKMEGYAGSMKTALSIPVTELLSLFFLSIFDRICNYGMTILLIIGMSYTIPVLQLVVANAAASLTNILPINSIGSFGTLELGWTGALLYYKVQPQTAISSGFSFHLLAFSFTIILGMTALQIMKTKYNINPFGRSFSK